MFQRELIELHNGLMEQGWDIRAEMTDRSKKANIIEYAFSKKVSENFNVGVLLKYKRSADAFLEGVTLWVFENGKQKYAEDFLDEDKAMNKAVSKCYEYDK